MMDDVIAPVIVVVAYDNIESLERLLNSLNMAEYDKDIKTTLIISIDYSGKDEVKKIAEDFIWKNGEKRVRTFDVNQGLRKHILQCADYSIEFGAAIILEDDIVVSPSFYKYAYEACNFYKDDEEVFAISLYSQKYNGYSGKLFFPLKNEYDVFYSKIECSWGECFIGKRWLEFRKWYDENEENLPRVNNVPQEIYSWKNSRSKYLLVYITVKNLYYITPYESFTTNFHKAGVHSTGYTNEYQENLIQHYVDFKFPNKKNSFIYDSFFESEYLQAILEKKYNKKICMDYFSTRSDFDGYDYLYTCKELPYEVVERHSLSMKPPELNFIYDIKGEGIYLYDLSKKSSKKHKSNSRIDKIRYNTRYLGWRDAFYTFKVDIKEILRRKWLNLKKKK